MKLTLPALVSFAVAAAGSGAHGRVRRRAVTSGSTEQGRRRAPERLVADRRGGLRADEAGGGRPDLRLAGSRRRRGKWERNRLGGGGHSFRPGAGPAREGDREGRLSDRKRTRLNSSQPVTSYAAFC